MVKKVIQPEKLFDSSPFHYSQVVTANGGTLVHISGLAAWNKDGQLVGGDDLVAQTRQTLANIRAGLDGAGAKIDDLIMIRSFIVNYQPEYFELLMPEFAAFFGDARPPASTWVGVQALALPDLLIEIEAQAVIG
jgi:enamine deaminase RidA (YjgF/YER057c/UK114 family)